MKPLDNFIEIIKYSYFICIILIILALSKEQVTFGSFVVDIQSSNVSSTELTGKTIVIDPGHGGADPGAMVKGLKESDINMGIALALKKKLELRGVKVKLTRNGNKGLVPHRIMSHYEWWHNLEKRKQFASEHKADLFISIHANSIEDPKVSGAIVFYAGEKSKNLAWCIQNRLNGLWDNKRQAEHAGLAIIRGNKIPSVLIETGFISNENDRKLLLYRQETVAKLICIGIEDYLKQI